MFHHYGMTPQLPNVGSTHSTPTTQLLDCHWSTMSLVRRWDWVRFVRLANFLQMTPWELASLAMIKHAALEGYKRRGVLPVQNPSATALLLTLLEAQAMKGWTADIIVNPWPSLSHTFAKGSLDPIDPHGAGDTPELGVAAGAAYTGPPRGRGRPSRVVAPQT